MNPRERPGKRGLVFPPSWQGERFTAAEEEAQERLQEAEGERALADTCGLCEGEGMVLTGAWIYSSDLRADIVPCPRCGLGTREEAADG